MNQGASVFANIKKYKDISERRSANFNEIDRAFDLVKNYIIDKKRLLYGGLCLDLNLKIAGHPGIYDNNSIPDYDIMSPDFYNDSNELAKILQVEGLINVSAINAPHFNSRRVRVNFITVCDISYIPPNIYEKIPYITSQLKQYKNLRLVHPDYQRLDMHRSFNIPFSNPPLEVISHRLDKDQKRFRLLDQQYPMILDSIQYDTAAQMVKITVDPKLYECNLIGGVFGYAILLDLLKKVVLNENIKKSELNEYIVEKLAQTVNIELNISDTIELTMPEEIKNIYTYNLITNCYQNVIQTLKDSSTQIIYYNKYLDNIRPRTIIVNTNDYPYEIFDIFGELIPCYNLNKVITHLKPIIEERGFGDLNIVQPNYLLLYFLQKMFESDTNKKIYHQLYQSIINIVDVAEKVYLLIEELKLSDDLYQFFPYFLSINTYGDKNWSTDYISMVKDKKYFLSDIPMDQRPLFRPMFGYYPDKNETWPEFNIANSELFSIDGLKRKNPFMPITL